MLVVVVFDIVIIITTRAAAAALRKFMSTLFTIRKCWKQCGYDPM